jgi:filamentous hemagglutinin
MNAGLTFAREHNLRPGLALTAAQVAQLTTDMVWLVTQEVTLPDGSKQSVLVPQVYVRVKPGDLDGTGALLAGKEVELNLKGNLNNSGTIAGRNLVSINANSIKNMGGTVSGGTVALQAVQDIDNIGGQIKAQDAAILNAGRDIQMVSTTQSSTNQFSQTGMDRMAGLYVSNAAGVLLAQAGNNLNLVAAQIGSAGQAHLSAGNNINLSTVSTGSSQNIQWDSKKSAMNKSQDIE